VTEQERTAYTYIYKGKTKDVLTLNYAPYYEDVWLNVGILYEFLILALIGWR
jgi:hypothetical protein